MHILLWVINVGLHWVQYISYRVAAYGLTSILKCRRFSIYYIPAVVVWGWTLKCRWAVLLENGIAAGWMYSRKVFARAFVPCARAKIIKVHSCLNLYPVFFFSLNSYSYDLRNQVWRWLERAGNKKKNASEYVQKKKRQTATTTNISDKQNIVLFPGRIGYIKTLNHFIRIFKHNNIHLHKCITIYNMLCVRRNVANNRCWWLGFFYSHLCGWHTQHTHTRW